MKNSEPVYVDEMSILIDIPRNATGIKMSFKMNDRDCKLHRKLTTDDIIKARNRYLDMYIADEERNDAL